MPNGDALKELYLNTLSFDSKISTKKEANVKVYTFDNNHFIKEVVKSQMSQLLSVLLDITRLEGHEVYLFIIRCL